MHAPEAYRVYAVRYALMDGTRSRRELFPGLPPSEEGPASIAYYVWAVVNEDRTIVVDTGMSREGAAKHGRPYDFSPREGLARLGIDTHRVDHLVMSHLHWDHAGNFDDFPNARVHVQESELNWAVGPAATLPHLGQEYDVDHLTALVRILYDGRVTLHRGAATIAPGVSVHSVPGHTPGQQVLRVWTRGGWMVIASDALHLYEQMERGIPFRVVTNVTDMLRGYAELTALADGSDRILAGHDAAVMDRFPTPDPSLRGVAVRCDPT